MTSIRPSSARLIARGVLLPLALAACGRSGTTAAPVSAPPDVTFVTVHKTGVPKTVELPGRTAPLLVAQVRARVDGIVLRRAFTEGADVKAGQTLFEIDPAPYRAALASAQATLERAVANVAAATSLAERYKVLLAGNGVSKQDYDNAVAAQGQSNADVASGKAAVQTAQINLGYTRVVSPITGRIGLASVTQGAYVQAGSATLLATVQQIDPLYVDLSQSSVQGLQLRRDLASGRVKAAGATAKVTLTLEDGTAYPTAGTLQFTDITVDPTTGSVTVRAQFPNSKGVLLPGMFVRARIDEGIDAEAIRVPQVGVTHDPSGKAAVLVVGTDGKIASRIVDASRTVGSDWVVDSGLADGDRVVVAGGQKVKPGTAVHAVEAPPPSPAPAAPAAAAAPTN